MFMSSNMGISLKTIYPKDGFPTFLAKYENPIKAEVL